MFAIQNQKTGKFLYGTDYRYNPPRQRTSFNEMRTYSDLRYAVCVTTTVAGVGKTIAL